MQACQCDGASKVDRRESHMSINSQTRVSVNSQIRMQQIYSNFISLVRRSERVPYAL